MVIVGGAAFMVNPPDLVAVPPGVVTETSLAPVVAEPEMEILAVICVELSTVKELTVILEPKLTEVAPVRYVPVMMTLLRVCPWMPLLGLTVLMVAGAWLTLKPPVLVAVPPGVVTETSLAPAAAEPLMLILAVIWVELSTVKLFTVIPEPKLTAEALVK